MENIYRAVDEIASFLVKKRTSIKNIVVLAVMVISLILSSTAFSQDVLFSEDFDGQLPAEWVNNVISGPNGFPGFEWTTVGGNYGGQLNSTTSNNGYLILDSDGNGSNGSNENVELITPSIDCSNKDLIEFSVEHYARSFGNATVGIFVSSDNFASQNEIYSWSGGRNSTNGTNPVVSNFDISEYAANESNVKIKFKWQGEYDYWWLIDDVEVTGLKIPGGSSADMVYWLRGDLGVSGSTPITKWADQSGNGNDASPDPNPNGPNQVVSTNLNGQQAMAFDGSDGLNIPDNARINNGVGYSGDERTMFMVFFTGLDVTTTQYLYEQGGGTNGASVFIKNSNVYVTVYNGGIANRITVFEKVDANSSYILSFNWDKGELTAQLNNSPISNQTSNGAITSLNSHSGDVSIGFTDGTTRDETGGNQAAGAYFNGEIAEIIYYDQSLLMEEEFAVNMELAQRYGVGLSSISQYYSYRTGNWDDPTTWTHDPSGTTQTASTIPGENDEVVILNGREVRLTFDITTSYLDITLRDAGILNQSIHAFTGTLKGLRGTGTFKLASANFPSVIANELVETGGGTIEYYNSSNFELPNQVTYNNLVINTEAFVATQKENIHIYGKLVVKTGTFRINDDSSTNLLSLEIDGDVIVDANAKLYVGEGKTNHGTESGGAAPFNNYYTSNSHTVIVKGDFTNNGTIRFTNQDVPNYTTFPTNGFATVYFQGATDNTLYCNGITDFYNVVLDKGLDQTYMLTLQSTAYNHFRLFGRNDLGGEVGGANPNLRKALWIRTGTLVLEGMTVIPALTEGVVDGTPNGDYYIPGNAALVLNGPEVIVLSTADDYREVNLAYGLSAANNNSLGLQSGGAQSFSIYGKLVINDGYMSTRESGGIITWDVASGQLEVNGGFLDAKQIRAAGGVSGKFSYQQSGGTVALRGRFQRVPQAYSVVSDLRATSEASISTTVSTTGLSDGHATFNINSEANVFIVSGGKVQIHDVSGTSNRAIGIFAAANNINVTGGIFEIIPLTGNAIFNVNSTASFGDFVVNRRTGTAVVRLDQQPLVVKNNLIISAGVLDANNLDVSIGGNFSVVNGGIYNSGANSTLFNGSGNQLFSVNGTLNNGSAGIARLSINKSAGSLKLAGDASTIAVQDDFELNKGLFDDGGKTLSVAGNIKNASTHIGEGKVQLNGTNPQIIIGGGVFQNLDLNNNSAGAPIVLGDDLSIEGQLQFSRDRRLDIASYNLKMGTTANFVGVNGNRYVVSSGQAGAGGITKVVSEPGAFLFPVGVANYTPATITLNGVPNNYGMITVVPVNMEHPNTTVKGRSLSYYWRVKSQGFDLGSASISHGFVYADANVVTGTGITEAGYVAARYQAADYSWSIGSTADMDVANNRIGEPGNGTFLQDVSFIDGEYTAGDNNPGNPFGVVTKFYSRESNRWNRTRTWSTTGHDGNEAARIPAAGDAVIIGDNHTVTVTANAFSGSLQIEDGAVLDVQTYTNSNFGSVINHPSGNNGLVRVTSTNNNLVRVYNFPQGDFSDFNVIKGTTEFYSTDGRSTAVSILPANVGSYGNLLLTPFNQDNLVLPNKDITIYGDLTCHGSDINSWIAISYNNNTFYRTIEKTVYIKGNVNVLGGSLIFTDDYAPQHLIIDGNINVSNNPQAGIDVRGNNWIGGGVRNNTMSVGGSINNNNLFRLSNNAYYCDITFHGSNSAQITNSQGGTPNTILRNVTVNKGNSQATKLTINIGGTLTTPVDNWLTLENGTLEYMRVNPNSDLTITTSSPFTIPSTSGLWVDYSGTRNVLIANANSDTNDMYLNGKLTVVNGRVYVGPVNAPNNNNDIEYAGGGASSIDVLGGQLVVNGQIRRNPSTASGILKYLQSGGEVTINGRNANNTNAKLEVLNAGSVFNMSGGTLKLIRGGGGNAFGDLYLRPQSSSVTGGDIVFHNTLNNAQQYLLDATVPLNKLNVIGNTISSSNATVKLLISPLTLKGNLELNNGNSVFDANEEYNIGLTIKGNLVNNGTFEHREALTTLNGGVQSVEGSSLTGFYDLKVNPVTSVTMTKDVFVAHNLELASGQLLLHETVMTVGGDLINDATYRNAANQGKLVLAGSETEHQISGTGTFGRLELNNMNGARLLNDITLQNDFVLSAGVFNVNQFLLTLGQNASIIGSGFGGGKMIASDGVYSSRGIRKFFPVISSTQEFTFPMGFGKKYTPAILTITKNDRVGSVRVNTINQKHPSAKTPFRVLNYYWEVESSAIDGFTGEMNLYYHSDDVLQSASDEAGYAAARLLTPGIAWNKAAAGADNVLEAENRIHFTYPGVTSISGEYTAGLDEDIPDNVPVYESIINGEWSDKTIWVPVGDAPACPDGGPNGAVVIINHEVTASTNYCFAYKTTIKGTLKILNSTYGHNLGAVNGGGTLYLESALMPAARFDDFFSCANNATLELGGSSDYYIVADLFSSLANLKLSGTGRRYLPNKTLTVCNSLVVDGAIFDNSVNNKGLLINGSFELVNGGQFRAGTGSDAIVRFAGSAEQYLGGAGGSFVGSNAFNSFEVANASGLTLLSEVELTGSLVLTNGVIRTSSSELLKITNILRNSVTPQGGHAGSFVDGPLSKRIVQGDSFTFPVGKDGLFSNGFTLSAVQSGTLDWMVEYSVPNENYMDYSTPLSYVNSKEHWLVTAPGGSAANIGIAWTTSSDVTPVITEGGLSDLRVSTFDVNDGLWEEVSSAATGSNNSGVVTTSNRVSFNGSEAVKFTSATVNSVKPKAKLTPSANLCGTEQGIPVTFTSSSPISLPYVLRYAIDGVEQDPLSVVALPFVLLTPSTGIYQLLGFAYNNGLNDGVVDSDVIAVYAIPTAAAAGDDLSDCGATRAQLAANEPTVGAGLWSIVSGTGGTVVNPTQANSIFQGTNGSAYTLRWTISNGTCESFDEVAVVFPLLAEQPGGFNNYETTVCRGALEVVYSVPLDATVSYSWEYSGSDVVIEGAGNSARLQFGPNATGGTLSVVTSNDCNVSHALAMDITVNESVPVSLSSSADGETLCAYNSVLYTAAPIEAGLEYSFYVNDVLQQTGTSHEFLAENLTDGARVYVEGRTGEGCKTISNELVIALNIAEGVWVGMENSDWSNPKNWCNGNVPVNNNNLVISSKMVHQPVVTGELTLIDLTIEQEASLLLDGGSKVNLEGSFSNDGEMVLNHRYGADGMVSLMDNSTSSGSGTNRIRLTTPPNQWFYLGSSVKDAVFSDFSAGADNIIINVYRANKWWGIKSGLAHRSLRPMEGIVTNLLLEGSTDNRLIEYTGVLHTAAVSRTYDESGYHLLANPYPSFISWEEAAGWDRPNVSGTIWYRGKIGEEMAFITYNRDVPLPNAKVALYPDTEVTFTTEEELALIPPMQAVWVSTSEPGVTVTVKPEARRHGIDGSRLKSSSASSYGDVIRIETENEFSRDGAVLYFSNASEEALDKGDSEKYFNDSERIPEIYTRVGDKALSINGLPLLNVAARTIPLSVRNRIAGEVTMRFDLSYYYGQHAPYLEDRETGAFINLLHENTYTYTVSETGENHDRFVLNFYLVSTDLETPGEDETDAGSAINIKSMAGKVLVSMSPELTQSGNAMVEVYTIDGRKVDALPVRSSRTLLFLPDEKGVYIIRAVADKIVKSERVIYSGK